MNDIAKTTAEKVNALHAEIAGHATSMIGKAIEIGELLGQQEAALPHGEWLSWIESSLTFGISMAQKYMRVATNAEPVTHLDSVREAVKLLAGPQGEVPEINMDPVAEAREKAQKAATEYLNAIAELPAREQRLERWRQKLAQVRSLPIPDDDDVLGTVDFLYTVFGTWGEFYDAIAEYGTLGEYIEACSEADLDMLGWVSNGDSVMMYCAFRDEHGRAPEGREYITWGVEHWGTVEKWHRIYMNRTENAKLHRFMRTRDDTE